MTTSHIPPIAKEAYTLFVKVWPINTNTPADEAEAIIDSLDNYLLSIVEASDWFPSPYGGAVALPTVDEAITAAKDLITALAKDGIEVSIAICRGRLDRVLAVDRWNITALAMNLAARLANVEEAQRHIVVDPTVRQDAVMSSRSFTTLFGEERSGLVKRTKLRYHLIQTPSYTQIGDLQFSFCRSPAAKPSPLAAIVCFDIERYSEKEPAKQNSLVEALNKCVELALSMIHVKPADFGPAGDGGYIAFLPDTGATGAVAWTFAEGLVKLALAFKIPLRVGISAGPVRHSQYRPAVGGAVLRADQVSSAAPIQGIATTKDYWSLLPEPMKTGLFTEAVEGLLDVLSVSSAAARRAHHGAANPRAFYSGAPATAADIAAGLDIPRTQYIHNWTDEKGEIQSAWRSALFSQALHPSSKGKNRVVVLYGHRGSGKTTLCRRMIHDLREAGMEPIDLLSEPLELSTSSLVQLPPIANDAAHVFVEIGDIYNETEIRGFAGLLKILAESSFPVTLYLAIDTNKWRQIEGRLGSITRSHNCSLHQRRLRGQLDEQELGDLIQRLKVHHCLFRLSQKSDEAIWFIFRRKAKRDLLTALIEATRGTEAAQDLPAILWEEFVGMNPKAQWAYSVVTMFQAFNIEVPRDILEHSLLTLTGDKSYFASPAFVAETADIVNRTSQGGYTARHPLIAETLLFQMNTLEWEDYKLRILLATLGSLRLSDTDHSFEHHDIFFHMLNDRKVVKVLADLHRLVRELRVATLGNIQGRNKSRLLNGIVRVCQSRGRYVDGKEFAIESLELWDHIGNQASYLQAFCDYKLGEKTLAMNAAKILVQAHDYPHFVLHGITLLCILEDWGEAEIALDDFEEIQGPDKALFASYFELRRRVDLFTKVGSSRDDFQSLPPALQLEKLEIQLEETADEETVISRYQELVRRDHNFFRAFLAFFRYLHRLRPDEDDAARITRMQRLREECEYHIELHANHFLNYSKDVLSLLCSNIARSLFKIDYLSKSEYTHQSECEEYFQRAISLKSQNWYAHNWYGTFLKDAKGDCPAAEHHYSLAVNGDMENPVFKYNLSLLLFREDKFHRQRLERARDNAVAALSICHPASKWKDFAYWPQTLLGSIELLLSRSDLEDGQLLDPNTTLPSDPE